MSLNYRKNDLKNVYLFFDEFFWGALRNTIFNPIKIMNMK